MIEDHEVRVEYLALQMYLAQMIPVVADHDKQMQALELAYGNLATSSLYKPSRAAFHEIAIKRYHWSEEEFDEWAGDPLMSAWAP